jgi:hypothetical protein
MRLSSVSWYTKWRAGGAREGVGVGGEWEVKKRLCARDNEKNWMFANHYASVEATGRLVMKL